MAWLLLLLLTTQILLPVFFLTWLWLPRPADRLGWITRVAYGAAFIAFITVIGRWDFLSAPIAYALPAIFLVAVVASYMSIRKLAWNTSPSIIRSHGFTAAMAVFFLAMTARALSGYGYQETAVELAFPFGSGTYYVGQGGSSTAINYHHANQSQSYALDIVALDGYGARAKGLMPYHLTRYAVYDREVKSPCTGLAISTRDGVEDNSISQDRKSVV